MYSGECYVKFMVLMLSSLLSCLSSIIPLTLVVSSVTPPYSMRPSLCRAPKRAEFTQRFLSSSIGVHRKVHAVC
ncbi:hypothetical protein HYPSUDRAFT_87509 [Hypholoma sublateritium FD-334 SS-4]|uniref:Uncharacterized protein n=1 Tax=Hypholoma sublateritium (strain FD-334 SS-4) TaxID=945553 RepID=A0A0D2NTW0_HYPSF|nr:hypothetical protein HYPSUDRAFT_87509 [Hypholoma sublateritium FD-334 SS-4]